MFASYLLFLVIFRLKTFVAALTEVWSQERRYPAQFMCCEFIYSELRETLSSFPLTSQLMSIGNRQVLAIREVNSYL
jgi:hypothetical protein